MQKITHASQRQIMRNLSGVLEDAGSSLQSIVKANVYLTSMGDFGAMDGTYLEYFTNYVQLSTESH